MKFNFISSVNILYATRILFELLFQLILRHSLYQYLFNESKMQNSHIFTSLYEPDN